MLRFTIIMWWFKMCYSGIILYIAHELNKHDDNKASASMLALLGFCMKC